MCVFDCFKFSLTLSMIIIPFLVIVCSLFLGFKEIDLRLGFEIDVVSCCEIEVQGGFVKQAS